MAEQDNIQVRVSATDEASPVLQEITAREQALARETEQASRRAERAAERERQRAVQLARLKERLGELLLEQQKFQQAQQAGLPVSAEELRAEERRATQVQRITRVLGEKRKAQDLANQAVENAAGSSARQVGILDGMASAALRYAGALLSAQGLVAALNAQAQALQENARLTNELKAAQLDLQFLNQGFRADELLFVKQASEIRGGKDAILEMSAAFAQLKSQTANLGDADRLGLFRQLVETSLTTSSSPTALVELFTATRDYVPDVEVLQNLVRKAQELSPEASPTALATVLPRVLPIGREAGLSPEETTGLLVTALNITRGDPQGGATQLRNILARLTGKDASPEAAELMAKLAPRELPVRERLQKLAEARQSGQLDAAGVTTLFNTENLTVALGLTGQRLPEAEAAIGQIQALVQSGRDATREAIENIFRDDKAQGLRLMTGQAEARAANLRRNDVRAQELELAAKITEEVLREKGVPEFTISAVDTAFWAAGGLGFSPEQIFSGLSQPVVDPTGTARLLPPLKRFQAEIIEAQRRFRERRVNLDVESIGATPATPDAAAPAPAGDLLGGSNGEPMSALPNTLDPVLRRLDELQRQQRMGAEDLRMSARPQVIINEMRVFGVDPRFDVRHPLDTLG